MNKPGIALLLAAGLFLFDVAPAQAHKGYHEVRRDHHGYRVDVRRHDRMPRWLKRDKHFRHWYRRSPLRHRYSISWNELFDIYRWERYHYGPRYWTDYGYDGYRRHDRRWHRRGH